MPTREDVIEALREVEDPELGMDIVELGLMYDVEVDGPSVKVLYSLTSMGCPAGAMIAEGIVDATRSVPGVDEVEAELTSEPVEGLAQNRVGVGPRVARQASFARLERRLRRVVAIRGRDDGARARKQRLGVTRDLRLRHREAHVREEAKAPPLADVPLGR